MASRVSTDTASPLRKSLILKRVSVNARRNEEQNDDEAERAALLAEDRNRATSQFSTPRTVGTPSSVTSGSSIGSPQKEHFQGCLKLFAENKINKNNVWSLHLIDYMTSMLRKHDSRMENLQMASTTLDASAKIYSFRVDAVHHDVLLMAGGLSKAVQSKRGKKADGEEDDEGGAENDGDGDGNTQRRKEKKKKSSKSCLSTNVEHQLNGEVEVNECIDPFFAQLAATTGDMTSSNRAFNATLPLDDKTLGLILRSDALFLDNINDSSEKKQLDPNTLEKFVMKKSSALIIKEDDQICGPFHGFSLTNWDPETEEANMANTNKWVENNLNLSQQAMAFDLNADVEPLPQNDDGFVYDDDGQGPIESDEEEMDVMSHTIKRDKKMVAPIMDMRPSAQSDAFLEYSYSSAVIGSWAGPSHWKLKNNINRISRMVDKTQTISSRLVKKAPAPSRKKKQLDFLGVGMSFNRICNECPDYSSVVPAKIMITVKTLSLGPTWNEKNFRTPIDRGFNLMHFRKFYLKQNVILKPVNEEESNNEKNVSHRLSDINDYDYNNDNDTSYCPNSQPNEEGGAWLGEEGNEPGDVHNQFLTPEINGDMVEPPAKVAKIFIPYAMRAKKVDMKQLKQVTWKMLTCYENGPDKENEPNNCLLESVRETTFTNLYKKLPLKLSTNMKESLSVALSLLAVLHLANEKTLTLKNNATFTDFSISK